MLRFLPLFLLLVPAAVLLAQEQEPPPQPEPTPIPAEELEAFGAIYQLILLHHPDTGITPEQLMESAIRGMLSSVDNHSEYYGQRDIALREKQEFGWVQNIGLNVVRSSDGFEVVSVHPNSPAYAGGVRARDLLLQVDGNSLSHTGVGAVRELLGGKAGSRARLTVLRNGKQQAVEFVREQYEIVEIEHYALEGGYGHIRIHGFSDNTAEHFEVALAGLLRLQNRISGLVLDLRGNPGGRIDSAMQIAQMFIDGHILIGVQSRPPAQPITYRATRGDVLSGTPIVVLVDRATASSAEMLASALQQNNRAVIVGGPTFGKASVQTLFPLGAQRELRLTTGYYLDVNGNSIQAKGINPDVLLAGREMDAGDEGASKVDWVLQRGLDVLRAIQRIKQKAPPKRVQEAEPS